MSRRGSANSRLRRVRRLRRARSGATSVEFALLLPIILALSVGLVELGLIVFDYHRAGEAMRRAARMFEIGSALTSYASLPVECPGGSSCDGARINAVIEALKAGNFLPEPDNFSAANLKVSYALSGLDEPEKPFVTPVVTVSIVGIEHKFAVLTGLMNLLPADTGFPESFTFPPFTTTRIAAGEFK